MTQRFLPALLGTAAMLGAVAAAPNAHAIGFVVTNLVSDGSVPAAFTDTNLINPWGVSYGPTGPFWISDNGTGLTSLKRGDGSPFPLLHQVALPSAAPSPTGQVFNSGAAAGAFQVGGQTPLFLFSGEDGHISGWSIPMGGTAQVGFTSSNGAVYKGLAIATTPTNSMLYAADFHNNAVDLFTNNLGSFTTFTDPGVATGYAPFNTQVLNGKLYVTFALQDVVGAGHDDVGGPGNGYVDVFNLDGTLDHRIASAGDLNLDSPWGLAIAPSNWGPFAGKLLVGNFGDGTISVFDQNTNAFLGKISDTQGNPLTYGDLWALIPGNGALAGDTQKIYFTAGLVEESEGLFASIGVPEPRAWALMILGMGLAGAALRRRRAQLARA